MRLRMRTAHLTLKDPIVGRPDQRGQIPVERECGTCSGESSRASLETNTHFEKNADRHRLTGMPPAQPLRRPPDSAIC